jgi:hypothetical protein
MGHSIIGLFWPRAEPPLSKLMPPGKGLNGDNFIKIERLKRKSHENCLKFVVAR